jgi:hypothetical protein
VNAIRLTAGGTISQSPLSTLEVDATAWGARTASIPSELQLTADAGLQLFGSVQSLDAGSDVTLQTDGQVLIGGLITAADQLQITGGQHGSATGIVILPIELDSTGTTRLSGGEIRTGFGGRITLQATDGILLQGNVGSGQTAAGGIRGGHHQHQRQLGCRQHLGRRTPRSRRQPDTHRPQPSTALTGGQIRTSAPDATVRLTAADLVFVEAAGSDGSLFPAGTIQTAGLVHLHGTSVVVDGIIQSLAGRVLVSGCRGCAAHRCDHCRRQS